MRKIYIAKADKHIEIDETALPAVSLAYFLDYGMTQALSDAAASVKKEDPECAAKTLALVDKRLAKILAGNPPAVGERTSDPVKADAIDLAIEMTVKGQFKAAKKPLDAKAMRAAAIELIGRNPAYLHLAQKRADEAKAMAKEMEEFEAMLAAEPKTDEPTDENAVL